MRDEYVFGTAALPAERRVLVRWGGRVRSTAFLNSLLVSHFNNPSLIIAIP
jgi:hypothetical protein